MLFRTSWREGHLTLSQAHHQPAARSAVLVPAVDPVPEVPELHANEEVYQCFEGNALSTQLDHLSGRPAHWICLLSFARWVHRLEKTNSPENRTFRKNAHSRPTIVVNDGASIPRNKGFPVWFPASEGWARKHPQRRGLSGRARRLLMHLLLCKLKWYFV